MAPGPPSRFLASLANSTKNISTQRLLCYLLFLIASSIILLVVIIPASLSSSSSSSSSSTDFVRTADISGKGFSLELGLPKFLSDGAHTPPPKSTNGTGWGWGWYSNWDWLNPFGSSEDYASARSVLPPPVERCPIYAYYDKEVKENAADNKVMAAWRKAWWAAGMKPIILGPEDSKKHGHYPTVLTAKHSAKLEYNFMRWLAWDRMGTGAMSDFRVFPMAPHNDPTLNFLRRCEFDEKITRFENFGGALFVGNEQSIHNVVNKVASTPNISAEIISPADLASEMFKVDQLPSGLAYYSKKAVADKYQDVKPDLLSGLINAHLHNHFLSLFPDGFAVLNSDPPLTNQMAYPALEIAYQMAQCPSSPKPNSCPPNKPSCTPCGHDLPVKTVKEVTNSTGSFIVGMIPHPFTTQAFVQNSTTFNVAYVRRNTTRDRFLRHATTEIAGAGTSALHRASKLKEYLATKPGSVTSIWAPAEFEWNKEAFEYVLGFNLPKEVTSKVKMPSDTNEKQKEAQIALVKASREAMEWESRRLVKVRSFVEDWNIADFEVWKFTLAFNERRRNDREKWDKEEKAFSKGFA